VASLGKFFSENVKYTFFRKPNFIFGVFQEFLKFVFFQPIISSSKTPEIRHFETIFLGQKKDEKVSNIQNLIYTSFT